MGIGIDLEEVEEKEARWAEAAGLYAKLEEFLKDKKEVNAHQLIIDAYEGVNTLERVKERQLLNQVRFEEHEKNRPPSDKWYALKDTTFSAELVRNRVSLKPNNENEAYLKKLRDSNLY
jgi:hypothetical protein